MQTLAELTVVHCLCLAVLQLNLSLNNPDRQNQWQRLCCGFSCGVPTTCRCVSPVQFVGVTTGVVCCWVLLTVLSLFCLAVKSSSSIVQGLKTVYVPCPCNHNPRLEGTCKDYRAQLLAPHSSPVPHPKCHHQESKPKFLYLFVFSLTFVEDKCFFNS